MQTTRSRSWLLLALGGLLFCALASLNVPLQPVAPAAERFLTIGGVTRLEQSFTVTRPRLIGLVLRLDTGSSGAAAPAIPLRLRYADGPPVDLVALTITPAAARDGLLTVRFAAPLPVRTPYGITETLRLTLDLPALPPGVGLAVGVRANPAGAGDLAIDGRPERERDMVVAPLYERRLLDLLWPVSAMAAGKPGPLGEPLFYIGLLYAYGLGLAAAARAIYRIYLADAAPAAEEQTPQP